MSKLSLYDLSHEFVELEQLLLADGGEITEAYEELESQLFELIEKKTDGYVQFAQKLDDEIELASKHIKRLQDYKKTRQNVKERLKEFAVMCLERMGKSKINGEMGSISIGKPSQVLQINDESLIPDKFASFQRTIDKTEVKNALKNGENFDGAKLVDGKKRVTIKLKGVKDE